MIVNCYSSEHSHSQTVASAFAAGGKFPLIRDLSKLLPGAMFTYGNLRGLKPLLDKAISEGRDWFYGDNGYFKPGHYYGFYRITRNAYQHNGAGDFSEERFSALGLDIKPWKTGKNIIVCPPGHIMAALRGFDAEQWLVDVLKTLEKVTDRPIFVRIKPSNRVREIPLAEHLENAHALVCHSSNAAVDALMAGVPVFCTDPCASFAMGRKEIAKIEEPIYPVDRFRWACALAANQWTLAEMRAGICKKDLRI